MTLKIMLNVLLTPFGAHIQRIADAGTGKQFGWNRAYNLLIPPDAVQPSVTESRPRTDAIAFVVRVGMGLLSIEGLRPLRSLPF